MIPVGTRFIGISPSVDLTEKRSALLNKQTEPFTVDDIRGYKVYTALLTQSGGDDPIATILENTLGDIVWTRNTAGQYLGTLTGAFVSGKTVSPQFPALGFEGNGTFIPISANGNPQLGWINMYCQSENEINIDTYDMVGSEEWSIILGSSFLIEIRVYN